MKNIEIDRVKEFMNGLLCRDIFDGFLMAEASIVSKSTMLLDGHITEDFLSDEELETLGFKKGGCIPYGQMRDICFSFIKGKHTPKSFRIVLLLDDKRINELLSMDNFGMTPEDIGNLSLTIRFYEGRLALMTGCTLKTFTLDKSLENCWDAYITNFLDRAGLI